MSKDIVSQAAQPLVDGISMKPFFCREEHPLGGKKAVSWTDLKEAELIMMSSLSGKRVLLDHQLARKRLSGFKIPL